MIMVFFASVVCIGLRRLIALTMVRTIISLSLFFFVVLEAVGFFLVSVMRIAFVLTARRILGLRLREVLRARTSTAPARISVVVLIVAARRFEVVLRRLLLVDTGLIGLTFSRFHEFAAILSAERVRPSHLFLRVNAVSLVLHLFSRVRKWIILGEKLCWKLAGVDNWTQVLGAREHLPHVVALCWLV